MEEYYTCKPAYSGQTTYLVHLTYMFRDPSEIKLSNSQQKIFAGWKRPHEVLSGLLADKSRRELSTEPTMTSTSSIDLVQDVTSDCSVVASLCAVVARKDGYEKVCYYRTVSLRGMAKVIIRF